MKNSIEFTKVNRDKNGNPRYVCHFLDLLSDQETEDLRLSYHGSKLIDEEYKLALKKSRALGGKKFHNKQYGGGIVFQSYNIGDLEKDVLEIRNK